MTPSSMEILREDIDAVICDLRLTPDQTLDRIIDLVSSLLKEAEDRTNAVKDAWTIQGTSPAYHEMCKRRLETEWPILYRAIENLSASKDHS